MFEELRRALRELLHGNVPPEVRRSVLAEMKETLVLARMGLDDLRKGAQVTRTRLQAERAELETIQRRKALAQGIGDAETVAVAERFERQAADKVALLERKLEAEEGELALTEREVSEMMAEMKAAAAGVRVGPGAAGAPSGAPSADASAAMDELDLEGERLRSELDRLDRERRRAAVDAEAEERLAALKRRMGQ